MFRSLVVFLKRIPLALVLACGSAQAAEWIVVGNSKDGKVLVDVSSIRVVADVRSVWEKLVPKRPTIIGTAKPVTYELAKDAFNCSEEMVRQDATLIYYEDGTNETLPPESLIKGWQPVPPGTMLSGAMQFICAWKPK